MTKVFISVGMSGRSDADVEYDIKRIRDDIHELLGDEVEIVDNWDCQGPDSAGRLWYLGEAIKKLGECGICYFAKGWQNHKGCIAEYNICELYGIKIIEES